MSAFESLLSVPEREHGGSTALAGFEYQHHVAVHETILRYQADKDFAVIIEFHDDLAICDSATAPSAVSLIQVKSKTKARWTLASLCQASKNGGPSILKRMLENYRLHSPKIPCTCVFTGNAHINFGTKYITSGDGACKISGDSLSPGLVKTISSNLGLTDADATAFLADTVFEKHILPFESCSTHTLGLISELLTHKNVPHINATAFQEALLSEIRRRAAFLSPKTSVEEFLSAKSLRPHDITRFLEQAESKQATRSSLIDDIKNILMHENIPWNKQVSINAALTTCDAGIRLGNSLYHEYLSNLPLSTQPGPTLYETAVELERLAGGHSLVELRLHRLALCLIHLFSASSSHDER